MYYKLKCSPLTTWDQYNCGEWDYLTYTRVYNHTGLLDSTQVNGEKYLANTISPDTISITNPGTNYYDYYYREEKITNGFTANQEEITDFNTTGNFPFNTEHKAGRFQMIISASDLITNNVPAGDLKSLLLYKYFFFIR